MLIIFIKHCPVLSCVYKHTSMYVQCTQSLVLYDVQNTKICGSDFMLPKASSYKHTCILCEKIFGTSTLHLVFNKTFSHTCGYLVLLTSSCKMPPLVTIPSIQTNHLSSGRLGSICGIFTQQIRSCCFFFGFWLSTTVQAGCTERTRT